MIIFDSKKVVGYGKNCPYDLVFTGRGEFFYLDQARQKALIYTGVIGLKAELHFYDYVELDKRIYLSSEEPQFYV